MFKRDLPFKIGRNKFFNLSVRSIAAYLYYSIRQFQERKYAFGKELKFDWTEFNFSRTALLNLLIATHPKKVPRNI